ncbi:MAG: hypothetical protein ABSG55_01895 [Dehalococcoidia bacterium]
MDAILTLEGALLACYVGLVGFSLEAWHRSRDSREREYPVEVVKALGGHVWLWWALIVGGVGFAVSLALLISDVSPWGWDPFLPPVHAAIAGLSILLLAVLGLSLLAFVLPLPLLHVHRSCEAMVNLVVRKRLGVGRAKEGNPEDPLEGDRQLVNVRLLIMLAANRCDEGDMTGWLASIGGIRRVISWWIQRDDGRASVAIAHAVRQVLEELRQLVGSNCNHTFLMVLLAELARLAEDAVKEGSVETSVVIPLYILELTGVNLEEGWPGHDGASTAENGLIEVVNLARYALRNNMPGVAEAILDSLESVCLGLRRERHNEWVTVCLAIIHACCSICDAALDTSHSDVARKAVAIVGRTGGLGLQEEDLRLANVAIAHLVQLPDRQDALSDEVMVDFAENVLKALLMIWRSGGTSDQRAFDYVVASSCLRVVVISGSRDVAEQLVRQTEYGGPVAVLTELAEVQGARHLKTGSKRLAGTLNEIIPRIVEDRTAKDG